MVREDGIIRSGDLRSASRTSKSWGFMWPGPLDDAAMRLTTEAARLSRTGMRNLEAMRASMRALQQDTSAEADGRSFAHPPPGRRSPWSMRTDFRSNIANGDYRRLADGRHEYGEGRKPRRGSATP